MTRFFGNLCRNMVPGTYKFCMMTKNGAFWLETGIAAVLQVSLKVSRNRSMKRNEKIATVSTIQTRNVTCSVSIFPMAIKFVSSLKSLINNCNNCVHALRWILLGPIITHSILLVNYYWCTLCSFFMMGAQNKVW